MKKMLLTITSIFLCSGLSTSATIEVTNPISITDNLHEYDRNPSVIFDGLNYWLFYTKGDDLGGIRGEDGYNPDIDNYVVYFKSATSIDGLKNSFETQIARSYIFRPAGFDQRVVSAAFFKNRVYAFVSSGQSGTNKGLYYYYYSGSTWIGPITLIPDNVARGGHINVTCNNDYVYLVWESEDGSSDCYVWNGTVLSSKIDISSDNQPKITLMNGNLLVASIDDATGGINVHQAEVGPNPVFGFHSLAINSPGNYDPCIFHDDANIYVVCAPYVPADRQFLIQSSFDGVSWSSSKIISDGEYDAAEWWDYWPCGYFDGLNLYLFFASECNGNNFGDAEIACTKLNWNLDNDHEFFVQNAIDLAQDEDSINVHSGIYSEQIEIHKSIYLIGSNNPVIQAPSTTLQTYTVSESGAIFEPIIIAYGGTNDGGGHISGGGTIQVEISGLDIDGNNAGTINRFTGILARNCQSSSINSNNIYEMSYSSGNPQTSGILVYGNSNIEINHNTVNDFTRGGIIVNGDDGPLPDPSALIEDNAVVGEGPLPAGHWAQNGIQIGYGANGSIMENTVSNIWILDPNWSASGIVLYYPGGPVSLEGNDIQNCQGALNAYFVDQLAINNDNIFSGNDFIFIWGGAGANISGNSFINNGMALYISDATDATISNCLFDANQYSIIADGLCDNLHFEGNEIINSTILGIAIQPYYDSEPANVFINGNSIYDNAFGIDNTTSQMVNAAGNWWGDLTGPNTALIAGDVYTANRPSLSSAIDGRELKAFANNIPVNLSDRNKESSHFPTVSSGNGDGISPFVDYSPWWGYDYTGNPHTSPWNWHLNSSNNSTIQEGVIIASEGDSIHILPGLYQEQVVISKNGLTLIGSGNGLDSLTNTIIQSPLSLEYYFITGANNYPIIGIHDVSAVQIADCRVDGAGRGNGNYRFVGIGFWNAGGSVVDCHISGINDTPFSGAQHGNGIYAANNTNGPYNLNLGNVEIIDCQKNAMTLTGSGLNVYISGCSVDGHGPTSVTAQNGIQISHGAGGVVDNCFVSDFAYIGQLAYISSGMLFYNGTNVDVINGTQISGCQASVVYQETDGSVDDVLIQSSGVVYEEGISVRDYGYDLSAEVEDQTHIKVSAFDEESGLSNDLQTAGPTSIEISNSSILGVLEPGSYGIACWALGGLADDVNVQINNSTIQNWEYGIISYDGGGGSLIDVSAFHSSVIQNIEAGFYTNATHNQNASGNWWGSYCGPNHELTNPNGEGNAVSDFIVYDPWCDETFLRCDFSNSAAPAEVWVDDDYSASELNDGHLWCFDAFDAIQKGIDAVASGGIVNVAAGIYSEQVVINKSIYLTGSGNSVIQPQTGILNAYTIPESQAIFEPLIFAYGGVNDGSGNISGDGLIQLTINGFQMDGNDAGTVNRFTGIMLRNCQSSAVSNNDIFEMKYSSGNPQTSGILVYGNSNIQVDQNTINDFTRGGIVVNGDDGLLPDPTAEITNNIVIGEGPTPIGQWAQNGIQIGFGAGGSIIGNTVFDIATMDPNWSASGLIAVYPSGPVTIDGNHVHDCQGALNAYFADGLVVSNNNLFEGNDFLFFWGGEGMTVDENIFSGNNQAFYISDVFDATISDNTFDANQYGIIADGLCDNIRFTGNNIINNSAAGVVLQPYGNAEPANMHFNGNNISGNSFGFENSTSVMTDAIGNWWGDVLGPNDLMISGIPQNTIRPAMAGYMESKNSQSSLLPVVKGIASKGISKENPPSILLNGDDISSLVDYSPWWCGNYVGNDHSTSWNWRLNKSNSSTIQEGIDNVVSNDTLRVVPDIYSGNGNRNLNFGGKNLSLISDGDAGNTIIDCEQSGRGFIFENYLYNFSTVAGFTITRAQFTGSGGAFYIDNAGNPTISNCLIIRNNVSGNGGAAYCRNSNPEFIHNTIIWNSAANNGGAFYVDNCNPILMADILWQDSAAGGQEIFVHSGEPAVSFSDIYAGWPGYYNINCDPRFCDRDSMDFRLSDLSCCLDNNGVTVGAFGLGCTGDFMCGDVNGTGSVNGLDVIYMVNYLKGGPPFTPPIWRGDVNGSCTINGLDIVYFVNYLKGYISELRCRLDCNME